MTTWRRWSHCFGLTLGMLLVASTASANDCRESLLEESYACHFEFQVVTTTDGSNRILVDNVSLDATIEFSDFTLDSNPGGVFVGNLVIGPDTRSTYCSCKAEGDSADPEFAASRDFFCVNGFGEDVALMFEGRASGNGRKINQGGLWFTEPFFDSQPGNGQFRRGVFSCESQ